MHVDIGYILNQLLNDPTSALSSSAGNNANLHFSGKTLESLLNNFVKKNTQLKEMSTCIIEESRELLRAMKTCHKVESCQIYAEDDYVLILLGFPTKGDKMRACNDEENKLRTKIKNTFKIFFTVADMRRPRIEVKIKD